MRVTVRVPATVANLGPGFDCIALALQLQNDVRAEPAERTAVVTEGAEAVPALDSIEDSLVVSAYRAVCTQLDVAPLELRFNCVQRIPVGRGLGSSAAAIVAGVLTAVSLHQAPWDEQDVINIVAGLEGHADNAAAAVLGGLAIAPPDAPAETIPVPDQVRAVLWIPDLAVRTADARAVLPDRVARGDAVFNASRCALLVRALTLPDLGGLRTAMQDRLHQDARGALMPATDAVMAAALDGGADGASLAGAGPSVIALTASDPAPVVAAMRDAGRRLDVAARVTVLSPRNFGTRVDVRP